MCAMSGLISNDSPSRWNFFLKIQHICVRAIQEVTWMIRPENKLLTTRHVILDPHQCLNAHSDIGLELQEANLVLFCDP